MTNRKLTLIYRTLAVVTGIFVLPGLVSFILGVCLGRPMSFALISSGEWVSLVMFLVGAYVSGNVAAKHKAFVQPTQSNDSSDPSGGQPKENDR